MSAQLLPGTIVDNRYKVEAVIGEGGMGVVYRVFDLDLNRVAALKMLHAGSLEGNASKRFRREASTLAKLDHKNLVKIYSTGYVEQSYYVCMEYVEGTSLRHLLSTSERLPWRFVVNLCRQICAGLACAHARGIVHRDLTSNNVLVVSESENEPQVKIIDFGLCTGETSATTVDQRLTQTGVVVGSLHYMSPEQCSARRTDNRSDIYSLGCILYEALTSMLPFSGDTPIVLLSQHLSQPPRSLVEVAPDLVIPADLQQLVMDMLEKTPDHRVESVEKIVARLDAIDEHVNATTKYSSKAHIAVKGARFAAPVVIALSIFAIALFFALSDPGAAVFLAPPSTKQTCIQYFELAKWLQGAGRRKGEIAVLENIADCRVNEASTARLTAMTMIAELSSRDYLRDRAAKLARKVIKQVLSSKRNFDTTAKPEKLHRQEYQTRAAFGTASMATFTFVSRKKIAITR